MLIILKIFLFKIKMLTIDFVFKLHYMLTRFDEIEKALSLIKTNVFKIGLDRSIKLRIDRNIDLKLGIEQLICELIWTS